MRGDLVSRPASHVIAEAERLVDGAIGRTYAVSPEIDSLVYVAGANDLTIGERIPVRITDADDYDLFGIIIEGSSTAATN